MMRGVRQAMSDTCRHEMQLARHCKGGTNHTLILVAEKLEPSIADPLSSTLSCRPIGGQELIQTRPAAMHAKVGIRSKPLVQQQGRTWCQGDSSACQNVSAKVRHVSKPPGQQPFTA